MGERAKVSALLAQSRDTGVLIGKMDKQGEDVLELLTWTGMQ